MLDYKLIEAFARVVGEGGFERAARVLYLTQSAVSQRVRQLEENCGQVLLTRTSPPQPTAAGKALLKHYQQVRLLESSFSGSLNASGGVRPTALAIGVNADSLAFWFIGAVAPLLQKMNLLLDLRVDDQEQTHRYLRDGDVIGCVSAEPKAMQGCRVERLGSMTYRLLARPDFVQRWFPGGLTLEAVERAPAVIFNRSDHLHDMYLRQHCGIDSATPAAHYIPAPEQFLQVISNGYCHGMIPDWQSQALREDGTLVELLPGATVVIDLFWHCWNLDAEPLRQLSQALIDGAEKMLI